MTTLNDDEEKFIFFVGTTKQRAMEREWEIFLLRITNEDTYSKTKENMINAIFVTYSASRKKERKKNLLMG